MSGVPTTHRRHYLYLILTLMITKITAKPRTLMFMISRLGITAFIHYLIYISTHLHRGVSVCMLCVD